LIFGILIGTYSSIFVASPILLYLGLRPQDVSEVNEPQDDEKIL
jgi:preprotein translocase subunit SecF